VADVTEIQVGDSVVYAAHGVGKVVALGPLSVGEGEQEGVVVDLAAGLRVTLSLDDAAGRLRPVADGADLESVGETLAAGSPRRDGSWTKRIKDSKAKLASGRPADLAEIVRDGVCHERSAAGARLSHGERLVYLQARELLVREICCARGVDADEADAWIAAQIASSDERED
jgi:CarD family transcriptional regulator, regulator of rRNA transcription